jgi:phage baseplate assembly protein gpV
MSYIGEEIAYLRGEVTKLNQKLARMNMQGTVVGRDMQKGVKLDIGEDPETGTRIITDWTKMQGLGAGNFKFSLLPSIGEKVSLKSPSGVIGSGSVAELGTFDDENKRPDHDIDTPTMTIGNASFSIKDGEMKLTVGDAIIQIKAGEISIKMGESGFVLNAAALQMLGVFKAKNGNTPVKPTNNPNCLV